MSSSLPSDSSPHSSGHHPPNRDLVLPFLIPYGCYVASLAIADWIGAFFGVAAGSITAAGYALAGASAGIALVLVRRSLRPIAGPRSRAVSIAWGIAAGLLGCALWVGLLRPFVPESAPAWGTLEWTLRLAAASLVVPIFEEQLMRGYVLGVTVQWERALAHRVAEPLAHALDQDSVLALEPGACTWLAATLSTVAFAAGHTFVEWPAALVYGGFMAGLYAWRKDLLSCIVAHAVTNATLAVYVRTTGSWHLW